MIKVNEKLEKGLAGQSIDNIEKGIKASNILSLKAKKEATFALLYLRNSSRYKENPLYRKSSFENYLLGAYNIKYNAFLENARAFDKFEEEVYKYGVGLVSKISRKCGAKKERLVLNEIKKAEENLKTPIKRDKIEAIIQRYATPKSIAPRQDYKAMYVNEVKSHKLTRQRYKDIVQELKTTREQIEKLKTTVLELKPLRDMKEAIKGIITSNKNTLVNTESRIN